MRRPPVLPVVRGVAREAWGMANLAVRYPLGMRAEQVASVGPRETFGLPVVLVHGYFHNRSGFYAMSRALSARGFGWVHAMNYHPVGQTVPSLARRLSERVAAILEVSGAPRVHLVGHSLGGLIARWYVQEMDGAPHVDHLVAIGTPHSGTLAAYTGLGATVRQMRPGSDVIRRLSAGFEDCPTKVVNVYTDLDVLIVPPSSARLPDRSNVENVLVRGLGHGSLLLEPRLIAQVVDHLATADVEVPVADVRELRVVRRPSSEAAAEGPAV